MITQKDISQLQNGQKVYFPSVDLTATVLSVNSDDRQYAKIYEADSLKTITLRHQDDTITICQWKDLIVANVSIL